MKANHEIQTAYINTSECTITSGLSICPSRQNSSMSSSRIDIYVCLSIIILSCEYPSQVQVKVDKSGKFTGFLKLKDPPFHHYHHSSTRQGLITRRVCCNLIHFSDQHRPIIYPLFCQRQKLMHEA